jgi:hypothetical protein
LKEFPFRVHFFNNNRGRDYYWYNLGGTQSGSCNPTMSINEISNYLKTDLNWLKKKFNEYDINANLK